MGMGGLLDLANDPDMPMILSLLGGQGGLAARGMQGLAAMGAQQDAALKRKLGQAQIDNYQSEVAQRAAALAKQDQLMKMGMGLLSTSGAPARPATPGTADLNAALPPGLQIGALAPQPARPATPGGLAAADPNAIAAFHLMGGPDLMNAYKFMQEGTKREPGMAYDLPGGGTVMGPPKLDNNMMATRGPNGWQAATVPGAVGAVGDLKGAEATATERAKAAFDLTPYTLPGGSSVLDTRLNWINRFGQGGAPAPSTAPQAPAGGPTGSAFQGGSAAAAAPEQLRIMQAEYDNPTTNAADKAGLQREMARLRQQVSVQSPTGGGIQLQGAAEAGQVKNITEAGGKVNDAWLKTSYEPVIATGRSAQDMIETTNVARQALRSMGGSGWGTETKASAANILAGLGVANDNAKVFATNAQLFQKAAMERLWASLNAASGPQTEGDAQRAAKTFAALQNTTQANEYIMDLAQAKAERDKAKATFFSNALPTAQAAGDLSEVDRQWQKRSPSIFDMPSMLKWKQ